MKKGRKRLIGSTRIERLKKTILKKEEKLSLDIQRLNKIEELISGELTKREKKIKEEISSKKTKIIKMRTRGASGKNKSTSSEFLDCKYISSVEPPLI
jgi:hypothetical protein